MQFMGREIPPARDDHYVPVLNYFSDERYKSLEHKDRVPFLLLATLKVKVFDESDGFKIILQAQDGQEFTIPRLSTTVSAYDTLYIWIRQYLRHRYFCPSNHRPFRAALYSWLQQQERERPELFIMLREQVKGMR